ncbi:hypothetical protein [Amycolatopsis anabasis]|uniref:hypothetical protein n=1 Tax=Amycolatopsis anabasis TaxID=1840409 RepID=UPI00131B71B4|nr:hypothetical protein [Amycolatopsis anabasis]
MTDPSEEVRAFLRSTSQAAPEPVGTRIRMTGEQPEEPYPVPVGTEGTIVDGNGGQLWVTWEGDLGTSIVLTTDPYVVLDRPDGAAS